MTEACHRYEGVMSRIWMSHVTHMNEACHTYVCENVYIHVYINTNMLRSGSRGFVWMSHSYNESWHSQKWVMELYEWVMHTCVYIGHTCTYIDTIWCLRLVGFLKW